jgi:hypothetical protein
LNCDGTPMLAGHWEPDEGHIIPVQQGNAHQYRQNCRICNVMRRPGSQNSCPKKNLAWSRDRALERFADGRRTCMEFVVGCLPPEIALALATARLSRLPQGQYHFWRGCRPELWLEGTSLPFRTVPRPTTACRCDMMRLPLAAVKIHDFTCKNKHSASILLLIIFFVIFQVPSLPHHPRPPLLEMAFRGL